MVAQTWSVVRVLRAERQDAVSLESRLQRAPALESPASAVVQELREQEPLEVRLALVAPESRAWAPAVWVRQDAAQEREAV